MKTISLIALLSLANLSSFACPELAGEYTQCIGQNDIIDVPERMTIVQKVDNGSDVYTLTSKYPDEIETTSELVPDDQIIVEEDQSRILKAKLTCADGKLKAETEITYLRTGKTQNIVFTKEKVDGSLIIEMNSLYDGQQSSDSVMCN